MDGGALRQFELCTRAAQAGHEVTVVVPVASRMHKDYRPNAQFEPSGIRLVATRRRRRRELEALSAIVRRPLMLLRFAVAPYYGVQSEMYALDMRAAIRAQLARKPDVVTIEHDFAICLGDEIDPEIPKILMTQNVTSAYYRTRAEATSGARRALLNMQVRQVTSYVTPRLNGFAGITTVSTADAEIFRAVTDVPVRVVPNGTALDPVRPQPPSGPPELLFTGTLDYAPNRDGILWFASEIWPHILAQAPATRLLIVGRRPDVRIRRLERENSRIEVIGEVPEMGPYFERATAVVVPLRSGGGTRLKILDALASARPIVSTRIGAQGIDVKHGEQLLIGDEPKEFAKQVVRLLKDADLRLRLSADGRRLIDERYHWRAIAEQYLDVLDAAVTHTL